MRKQLNGARRQRGLSLVELMVGITAGMFIVAAASMLATNQLNDNRRLMLETQVQQEIRSAMDLIVRDVRRSSYWPNAASGVWRSNNTVVAANPYRLLDSEDGGATLRYSYQITVDSSSAGFTLSDGTIRMRIGNEWQAVTDPQTLAVTNLQMALVETDVPLGDYCVHGCAGGTCPTLTVRDVRISIVGRAVHDAAIVRRLDQTVRLPNDRVEGSCAL